MSNENSITYNAQGDAVCFAGPDAVELYRVAVLASAIGLLGKGIRPTRGMTMTKGTRNGAAIHRPHLQAHRARTGAQGPQCVGADDEVCATE